LPPALPRPVARPLQESRADRFAENLNELLGGLDEFEDLGALPFPRSQPSPDPEEANPRVEITVPGLRGTHIGKEDIVLPAEWVKRFEPGTIYVAFGSRAKYPYYVGFATLKHDAWDIMFSARSAATHEAGRELRALRALGATGVTPVLLDAVEYHDLVLLVMETPGSRQMEEEIKGRIAKATVSSEPLMPLDEALPLMISLLQCAEVLERKRIIHGELTEENIFIVNGGDRAMLVGFHAACVDGERGGGCAGAPTVSALRQAPEMEGGRPSGVSNNVWQLGLVFARMLLGGEVLTKEILFLFPEREFDDSTEEGQKEIRDLISRYFLAQPTMGYSRLSAEYADVLEIIDRMLVKNPAERWSASRVLELAREVAAKRNVYVPSPREPPPVFEAWRTS